MGSQAEISAPTAVFTAYPSPPALQEPLPREKPILKFAQTCRGTFATAASGGKREQKGVAAVAEDEHIKYAKADAVTAKGTAPRHPAIRDIFKIGAPTFPSC